MVTVTLLCVVNLVFIFCLICWLGRLETGLRTIDDKVIEVLAENAVLKADNRELRNEKRRASIINKLSMMLLLLFPLTAQAIEIPLPSPAPDLSARASAACWEAYLNCAMTQRDMRQEQIDCSEVIAHLGGNYVPLPKEDDIAFRMAIARAYAEFTTETICQSHTYHCHLATYQVWYEMGACYKALKKALRVVK